MPVKRTYIVTFPDGKEETVENLEKFSEEHGLNNAHMNHVAQGKCKFCHGFKVRYSTQTVKDWKTTVKVSIKSGTGWKGEFVIDCPNGKRKIVRSLHEFCRVHGLSAGNMHAVANGRRNHHKGYVCAYHYPEEAERNGELLAA